MQNGRLAIPGLLAAYAAMSFPDSLGVVADNLALGGIASSLVFAWFAALSLPSGLVCAWAGPRKAAAASLLASLPAFALLALPTGRPVAAAALAFAGAANVLLQVALPSFAAERFGASRQAGILTAGLFVKTLAAVAIPFAAAFFAAMGWWRLLFAAFGAVSFLAAAMLMCGAGGGDAVRRRTPSPWGVFRLLSDAPTALAALAFAAGVVADVSFNLSVPASVRGRFPDVASGAGAAYAAYFGVKLAATLAGAWVFARVDARRLFFGSAALAALGAAALAAAGNFAAYLAGVAALAAGTANVYGFVFAVASPRHPAEKSPEVSALLVMSIAGGALASPLAAAMRGFLPRPEEALALAAILLLAAFAALANAFAERRPR